MRFGAGEGNRLVAALIGARSQMVRLRWRNGGRSGMARNAPSRRLPGVRNAQKAASSWCRRRIFGTVPSAIAASSACSNASNCAWLTVLRERPMP